MKCFSLANCMGLCKVGGSNRNLFRTFVKDLCNFKPRMNLRKELDSLKQEKLFSNNKDANLPEEGKSGPKACVTSLSRWSFKAENIDATKAGQNKILIEIPKKKSHTKFVKGNCRDSSSLCMPKKEGCCDILDPSEDRHADDQPLNIPNKIMQNKKAKIHKKPSKSRTITGKHEDLSGKRVVRCEIFLNNIKQFESCARNDVTKSMNKRKKLEVKDKVFKNRELDTTDVNSKAPKIGDGLEIKLDSQGGNAKRLKITEKDPETMGLLSNTNLAEQDKHGVTSLQGREIMPRSPKPVENSKDVANKFYKDGPVLSLRSEKIHRSLQNTARNDRSKHRKVFEASYDLKDGNNNFYNDLKLIETAIHKVISKCKAHNIDYGKLNSFKNKSFYSDLVSIRGIVDDIESKFMCNEVGQNALTSGDNFQSKPMSDAVEHNALVSSKDSFLELPNPQIFSKTPESLKSGELLEGSEISLIPKFTKCIKNRTLLKRRLNYLHGTARRLGVASRRKIPLSAEPLDIETKTGLAIESSDYRHIEITGEMPDGKCCNERKNEMAVEERLPHCNNCLDDAGPVNGMESVSVLNNCMPNNNIHLTLGQKYLIIDENSKGQFLKNKTAETNGRNNIDCAIETNVHASTKISTEDCIIPDNQEIFDAGNSFMANTVEPSIVDSFDRYSSCLCEDKDAITKRNDFSIRKMSSGEFTKNMRKGEISENIHKDDLKLIKKKSFTVKIRLSIPSGTESLEGFSEDADKREDALKANRMKSFCLGLAKKFHKPYKSAIQALTSSDSVCCENSIIRLKHPKYISDGGLESLSNFCSLKNNKDSFLGSDHCKNESDQAIFFIKQLERSDLGFATKRQEMATGILEKGMTRPDSSFENQCKDYVLEEAFVEPFKLIHKKTDCFLKKKEVSDALPVRFLSVDTSKARDTLNKSALSSTAIIPERKRLLNYSDKATGDITSEHASIKIDVNEGLPVEPDKEIERQSLRPVFGKKNSKMLVMNNFDFYNDLIVAKSSIHGHGVFTPFEIPANTLLMEYKGEIIGKCMSDKRERLYKSNNIDSVYMFTISEDMIIDATLTGNKARYVNHSCNPNCEAILSYKDRSIKYCTIRNVSANEELLINYNMGFDLNAETCNCNDLSCKFRLAT